MLTDDFKNNLPSKQQEKTKWTTRVLLPGKAAAGKLAQAIGNALSSPLESILGLSVAILGFNELFGRHAWGLYAISFALLACVFYERNFGKVVPPAIEAKTAEYKENKT